MRTIFQKNCKKDQKIEKKGGKIFENLGKNVQNLKIFWKKAGDCVRLSHTNSQKMPCFFISSKATVWKSYMQSFNNADRYRCIFYYPNQDLTFGFHKKIKL